MSAGNWVALASVLLVIFLAAMRGAVKYVDDRDESVNARLAAAIEKGDTSLAHALDLLTQQLRTMGDQYMSVHREFNERQAAMDKKIDEIRYETTHTNGGGTVKGLLALTVTRTDHLEHDIEEIKDDIARLHPRGIV